MEVWGGVSSSPDLEAQRDTSVTHVVIGERRFNELAKVHGHKALRDIRLRRKVLISARMLGGMPCLSYRFADERREDIVARKKPYISLTCERVLILI
jgi:hypothetical protein